MSRNIYFVFFTRLVFLWAPERKLSLGLEFPGLKENRIFAMFQQIPY